jgi:hypothetical protein
LDNSSWIETGRDFPAGGVSIDVVYRKGTGSSHLLLPLLGPVIARALRCPELFRGSLNLWADDEVEFSQPASARCGDVDWLLVPVILSEAAVGVAARRPPPTRGKFIEVFACAQLAPQLRITYGARLTIRLLPGSYLISG